MYLGLLQMQWLQILMPLSTGTLGLMLPLRFGAMCAIFSPAGNSIIIINYGILFFPTLFWGSCLMKPCRLKLLPFGSLAS